MLVGNCLESIKPNHSFEYFCASSYLMRLLNQANYSPAISAVLTDDNSAMMTAEEDTENFGLLSIDPRLEPFRDHFKYRIKRYADQKRLIEKYEGSLEEFARGDTSILAMQVIYTFSFLCTALSCMWNGLIYFNIANLYLPGKIWSLFLLKLDFFFVLLI